MKILPLPLNRVTNYLETLKIKLIEEETRKGEDENADDPNHNNALVTKRKFNKSMKSKKEQTKFNGNCNICKKYGHYASDCRFKNENKVQKKNDTMTVVAFNNYSKKPNF